MTFIEYPKCLYKVPGPYISNGITYESVMAKNAEEEAAYRSDGWASLHEAIDISEAAKSKEDEEDNAPPTRAELEAEADRWNIPYDGRTTDKKLFAKIEEARKG